MTDQNYNQVTLSGNVYLKYYNESENPLKGDLLLYSADDSTNPKMINYEGINYNGYFKAKIYDGKLWHFLNLEEFLENKEYRFAKRQRPLDTANLCITLLAQFQGTVLHRTYRGHFTMLEYKPNIYQNKANRNRKKIAE